MLFFIYFNFISLFLGTFWFLWLLLADIQVVQYLSYQGPLLST